MKLDVFEELANIWDNIPKSEKIIDTGFDILVHKKLLDIFHIGEYFYYIANVRTLTFDLVSTEMQKMLGYSTDIFTVPFYISLIHPEDRPAFLNFETAIERFFRGISGENLFKYKMQYDYRIRKADGSYCRILSQFVIIQHDENNVRTFVVNTDISHMKKDNQQKLSIIGMDGEPSYYDVDVENIFTPNKSIFTKREKDILKALAYGMKSSEISEHLKISKYTVDSHRKNMLRKLQAKSTNEVIHIAFNNGWV